MNISAPQTVWQALGAAYFSNLSTFGALPERVILRLLRDGRILQLDAGEVLYRAGDHGDCFYVVLSGAFNNFAAEDEEGQVMVRHHAPGDDMGFIPMIALSNRTATAVAETDASVALEISSNLLLALHQDEPDAFGVLLLNLIRGTSRAFIDMAGRLAESERQLQAAKQRIAQLTSAAP